MTPTRSLRDGFEVEGAEGPLANEPELSGDVDEVTV